MSPTHTPVPARSLAALLLILLAGALARADAPPAAEPPAGNKPQPGVMPPGGPAAGKGENEAELRARLARQQAEAEESRRRAEIANASGQADRMRAAFEAARRPGPLARADEPAFEAVVAAYRRAIGLDPAGETGAYCRLRLAGAYVYVGQREQAVRIMQEAVNIAPGPRQRVEALITLALHHLQAEHDPAEALVWARRAQASLPDFREPDERTKWETAISQTVARCEAERAKAKGK